MMPEQHEMTFRRNKMSETDYTDNDDFYCIWTKTMQRLGERMQPRGGYQSDSGMSDQAASTSGPVQRGVTKRKADMRGSTDLYTEVRPSILSAERITITQHSGMFVVS